MNVNPISQTIQNNYSVKKSPNFKSYITSVGFDALRENCSVEDMNKIMNLIGNASDGVCCSGYYFHNNTIQWDITFPRGNRRSFFTEGNVAIFQQMYISTKKTLVEEIDDAAICGEIDDAYKNRIMAFFPKDEELCKLIKQRIESVSALNEAVAKQKKYQAEQLAKREEAKRAELEKQRAELEKQRAEIAKVEKEKETAFKTAYPILSALGLYGIFKNGKLPQKALQKAAKMIK